MKTPVRLLSLLTLALAGCSFILAIALAGCSFDNIRTPPRIGSVRAIDGVEVWQEGIPSRPYHVVGTVRRQAADQSVSMDQVIVNVVEEAQRRGVDAVVILNAVNTVSRTDVVTGRPILAPKVEAQLIRYD